MVVLNKLVRNLRIDRQFMRADALVVIAFSGDDDTPYLAAERISYGLQGDESADIITQNILDIALEKAYKKIPLMIAQRTVA